MINIKFDYMKAEDLEPGDLFLVGTDDAPAIMSEEQFNSGVAFSQVNIRLGLPVPSYEKGKEVCRITIEK
uniref:Uncharacterized protein n=1 Tax=viral metagenome TaxID=1070528 RepID=A0A6M3L4F1_9ZZZZ